MRPAKVGILLLALAAACGGTSPSGGPPAAPAGGASTPSYVVTIENLAYSPTDLSVPPGATVTVVNADGMLHSVTSESAPGAFRPGAVGGVAFDTGEFASGSRSFTIPASAPGGTVIPYFCTFHRAAMSTPNGTLTVTNNAAPTSGPAPMPGM